VKTVENGDKTVTGYHVPIIATLTQQMMDDREWGHGSLSPSYATEEMAQGLSGTSNHGVTLLIR
jgi:hypothetical protein